MAQSRTLFSILLQQPWWLSALAGTAAFALAQLVFPPVAPWVALPFLVIAAVVGWKQLRTLSTAEVDRRLQALRNMSWEQFSTVIAEAYRREGYEVAAARATTHDFTLTRNGRTTLLLCRRWKVNQLGIVPLKDLANAIHAQDAANGICLCAGAVSPNAAEFAAANPLTLVSGRDLAVLAGKVKQASDK